MNLKDELNEGGSFTKGLVILVTLIIMICLI